MAGPRSSGRAGGRLPERLAAAAGVLFWAGLMVAAFANTADADFAGAAAQYDGGDIGEAAREWQRLAKAGDIEAMVALAELYTSGQGVERDLGQAAKLYRQAARSCHPVAQLNLGDFFLTGRGVPEDALRAYAWFALAADQGRRWAAGQRDELADRLAETQLLEARRLAERLRAELRCGGETGGR